MTLTAQLQEEHELIRRKLELMEAVLTTSPNSPLLKECCLSLARMMERHVRAEETLLAPYAHRLPDPLRVRTWREHADEHSLLRDINELFASSVHVPTSAIAPRLFALIDELRAHMLLEEREVFPIIHHAVEQLEERIAISAQSSEVGGGVG